MSSLKMHTRLKRNKSVHKCDVCLKVFNNLSVVVLHKRTHFGERPHKCLTCGSAFTHGSSLKSHLKSQPTHKVTSASLPHKKLNNQTTSESQQQLTSTSQELKSNTVNQSEKCYARNTEDCEQGNMYQLQSSNYEFYNNKLLQDKGAVDLNHQVQGDLFLGFEHNVQFTTQSSNVENENDENYPVNLLGNQMNPHKCSTNIYPSVSVAQQISTDLPLHWEDQTQMFVEDNSSLPATTNLTSQSTQCKY